MKVHSPALPSLRPIIVATFSSNPHELPLLIFAPEALLDEFVKDEVRTSWGQRTDHLPGHHFCHLYHRV